MPLRHIRAFALVLFTASGAFAKTPEEVKSDVLSALSTPLPITIIGPLLTRDVEVSAEGEGFRARLVDTSLMGLFPFGEVSIRLEPIDDQTYRITDLRFPETLDFPGIAAIALGGMELSGTWSAASRSYSDLKWVIRDLSMAPAQGGQLEIGALSFDVLKEPDETNTESRLEISASAVSARGLMPDDVALGGVTALITANGEKPVDLYSLLREVIMTSGRRDGGASLRNLGASLLGNSYDIVTLDLSASNLSVQDSRRPEESFLTAEALKAGATLTGVAPRDWQGADITVQLGGVRQKSMIDDGDFAVDSATVTLSGGELPVADMFEAVRLISEAGRSGRPLRVSSVLDGLLEFGKLEIATEGKGLSLKIAKRPRPRAEDTAPRPPETRFETGFDTWAVRFGLADFNRNDGKLYLGTDIAGGRFLPGRDFPQEALPHIEAWFPQAVRLQSSVSSLNEGLLKRLFTDVELQNPSEPVELILPLVLYVSSSVFEFATGEDFYETALFRLDQSGNYRLYPTEVFGMIPYEGKAVVKLSGFDALMGYFERTERELRPYSDEAMALGTLRSGLIVMRNLAKDAGGEAYEWDIARPDIARNEIHVNDVVFRYPDFSQFMPLLMTIGMRF